MASSRRLYAPSLPCRVEIRNKKHKLRNDLLDFFDEKELVIPSGQVSSSGETFVASLVNTLWYIDGHHHVFNERSHKIPTIFEKFMGYNTPETSKHRKRSIQNMSGSILREYSNDLYSCLQSSFWATSNWKSLKPDMGLLAESVSDYATYLIDHNEKIKRLHLSIQPPRNVSDNLVFQFLPCIDSSHHILDRLSSKLQSKENYDFLVVEEVCPSEPRKKYEYLEKLKSGLSNVRVAMLTYTHGNNVGNVHFVWKVPDYSSEAFSQSLRTIEKAKEFIPVFHTRSMRNEIQCEECEMWRLIYSRHKLTSSELKQVTSSLEDYTYTCGASFSDLGLQGRLAEVCVRDVQCYSPLEKLYYALNKEQLCIYCCSNSDLTAAEGCYLQYVQCTAKPNISKRT